MDQPEVDVPVPGQITLMEWLEQDTYDPRCPDCHCECESDDCPCEVIRCMFCESKCYRYGGM